MRENTKKDLEILLRRYFAIPQESKIKIISFEHKGAFINVQYWENKTKRQYLISNNNLWKKRKLYTMPYDECKLQIAVGALDLSDIKDFLFNLKDIPKDVLELMYSKLFENNDVAILDIFDGNSNIKNLSSETINKVILLAIERPYKAYSIVQTLKTHYPSFSISYELIKQLIFKELESSLTWWDPLFAMLRKYPEYNREELKKELSMYLNTLFQEQQTKKLKSFEKGLAELKKANSKNIIDLIHNIQDLII